ncbi:deoxyinosine 3'endonuclease (endonuclease V) [Halovivax ruber XH-70]|uniref:Endonuclease V n=1 Tax=Halovivax ruber (strain DSM 18193 / JCM 13892 / XH-70) TaxID=797302 RepID=L0IF91_HALRX|nr:endonuclease V [Halovivax ruber]AGB16866.1 deoxyinosine 3'endonuclease (endonuclease V) [Halovivax ruber XH-70]
MSIRRPDLAPDPSLSRAEMESLQREIARSAVFTDDLGFDPALLGDPIARATADAPSDPDEAADSGDRTDGTTPLVAGVDQSFLLDQDRALSAIVVLRPAGSEWEVVERVHAVTPLEIPYIPGLLSFREGGAILAAVEELSADPDLYLFDGSGRIHFRQAGIATHIGVMLDAPSIGVAKNLLCGDPVDSTEGLAAGERVPIEANADVEGPDDIAGDETGCEGHDAADPDWPTIGYAVQSKQYDSPNRHVNPLLVSPGHRVSAATAADVVLAFAAGYKLPEPTRLADAYANDATKKHDS